MQRSILRPMHASAGASLRAPDLPDAVETYGDPAAELRALEQGCALLDETDRGAVRILGPDARDFLQRMLAGEVRALEIGQVRRNLLLTPKGKILHLFELVRLAELELLGVTAPGAGAALAAGLEGYRFSENCEILDATEEHAPLALLGPRAAETLGRVVVGGELPEEGRATTLDLSGAPTLVIRRRRHGCEGFLLDAGPEHAEALWRALAAAGAVPAGLRAREVRRIAAGEASAGVDVDDSRYPQEAHLEDAFSLAKGCYPGQEVVAKIDTYGGLQRQLVVLHLEGEAPAAPGGELRAEERLEGRAIGSVTSSVTRPGDDALALAFVKLDHAAPGTRLWLADGSRSARVVPRATD